MQSSKNQRFGHFFLSIEINKIFDHKLNFEKTTKSTIKNILYKTICFNN